MIYWCAGTKACRHIECYVLTTFPKLLNSKFIKLLSPMDELFEQERQARMSGDIKRLEEVQHTIIASCTSDDELIMSLRSLINKRKQEHKCIKNLIRSIFRQNKSVGFLKELLSRVIEGKIYLEDERLDIAEHIKTRLGNDIVESYSIIRDVPVETFTTVSEKKRNLFLFEQFRLALLLRLYDDAELTMRKVRKGYLKGDDLVVFLNYCILLKQGQNSFLEASKLYLELNEADESRKNIAMGTLFCMMSSCLVENRNIIEEKANLLEKFSNLKNNDGAMRAYAKKFCTSVLIDLETADLIEDAALRFTDSIDKSLVVKSIIEHNFFVVSKFFSKIKIDQLCLIMRVGEPEIIEFISEMVNEKYSTVRINQQKLLVDFGAKRWNDKVDKVLDKIVLASYMIHKRSLLDN